MSSTQNNSHKLARRLPANAAANECNGGSHGRACSYARTREWSPDHFAFRSAAGGNRDCCGPDHTRSVVLYQLSHSRRDFIDGAGFELQIRRREWQGVLDLEHRALNAARHRDGDGYL